MSALRKSIVVLACLAVVAPLLAAPPTNIKLATQAPANTTWHKALTDMGDAWNKGTAGRVTLTVYAGGTQGDEPTTIRMMRPAIGTLQAGLLTAGGLALIDDSFNVFGIPFFFETDEEELAVQEKLAPILEQKLEAKGFHLLCWGTGGWVELFSKRPLRTLADVKAAKLYTSKGDDRMFQWYASNAFHPVALLPADIPAQLKLATGLIDTAPSTPYLALTLQIFRDSKYMMQLHIAPLVGAMIMSTDAWNKIAPEDHAKITEAAVAMETRIRADAPKQDADSITAMTARGLETIKLDAKAAAEFRTAASQLTATMRGGMVPADIYDLAVQTRDAYRKSKGR
ncbi:MAG TPA: TRAP transporter substrate-binding protein DctP [Vicinamibacterales bacterium]|nr:TRAP transporter substrate-binding protein DctP [Vicinamibacterales bacterium]